MSKGYIKLHRAIRDCWIWHEDEPFTKRDAWIDLLLSANHAEKKILFEGKLRTIQAGQFHTSILKLSDRWKWDRRKTTQFLKLLESDEMITTNSTTHGTTITIVNWGKYQVECTTDSTTKGTMACTTDVQPYVQPMYTNKNDKECIKNDKEKREATAKRFCPPSVEEVRAYCSERNNGINAEAFVDFYVSKGWKVGKNPMKDWKACVRTWEQRHHSSTTPAKVNNEIMTYSIDETDERPPYYGFPPEWFEDGKLIEERITKIKQPAMKYRGLYEDVIYTEKELLEKYKMRKEWFDNHDSR